MPGHVPHHIPLEREWPWFLAFTSAGSGPSGRAWRCELGGCSHVGAHQGLSCREQAGSSGALGEECLPWVTWAWPRQASAGFRGWQRWRAVQMDGQTVDGWVREEALPTGCSAPLHWPSGSRGRAKHPVSFLSEYERIREASLSHSAGASSSLSTCLSYSWFLVTLITTWCVLSMVRLPHVWHKVHKGRNFLFCSVPTTVPGHSRC